MLAKVLKINELTINKHETKPKVKSFLIRTMLVLTDGLNYSSVILEVEPFEIATIDKSSGTIKEWQLNGLDVVSSRMAADLIRGMEKFIALDKSKD